MNEIPEKREDVNTKPLGILLKEGFIYVHAHSDEWSLCHVSIRERGVFIRLPKKSEFPMKEAIFDVVMEFNSHQEVGIELLPDHARRSRESKLFPFVVKNIISKTRRNASQSKLENNSICGLNNIDKDEVIFATSNGREMWEWASCIQWLGTKPEEENIPVIHEPDCITMHDKHYEDSEVLQEVLLKMFTYKNLPQKPIKFEDIDRVCHREHKYRYMLSPAFLYYPDDYDYVSHSDDLDSMQSFTIENHEELRDSILEDVIKIPAETKVSIENRSEVFGLFAYVVLVGACVQVNEKCFELITSSNMYDISSQVTWKGNSILSMLCEGQYNSARNYMVKTLFRLGYPKLKGYYAGHCDNSFSMLLAKPSTIFLGYGVPSGQPVHPDDQKLCQYLQEMGDCEVDNMKVSNDLIEASKNKITEFKPKNIRVVSVFKIPECVMEWGCTLLTKLDLSRNGIFALPEELYDFTALTYLNLSRNCLFGLSHKLGNLTELKYLNIELNLIEELPYTIENLDKVAEFKCRSNPITKPPSSIWFRGIVSVRNFFRDIRESGTEINFDLRLLVLGLSEAGKTSLINGMINPNTKALTRVGDRTVGIEKRTWVLDRSDHQQPINLLTYDFAGQEEYYITHHLFLGSKALYIIAFDLSKYTPTLLDSQIMLWWDSIQNRVCDIKSNDSKTPKVILVGTHADIVDDAQSCADDILRSMRNRIQSRMKSLTDRLKKLEEELEKLDPRKSKKHEKVDLEKRKKEYDMLSSIQKVQILVREGEVKKILHQQQCTIALPKSIQAVSSRNLHNFDKLKEEILRSLTEVGPSGRYFPHLDVPVPRSWFQVRRLVRQKSAQKGYECMKLPQYFKLLSTEFNISEDVGRRATSFCHDLGDVLFFDKEGIIFLQPAFLIDVFKYVIRHDHKESTFWTEDLLNLNVSEEKFNEGKDLFLRKGVLHEWLLKLLWSKLRNGFIDTSITNNLIQLLETFDIATSIECQSRKRLLVPEFQPHLLTRKWPKYKENGEFEIQRWISADQKLPHGLLKRIQVRVLKRIFKRSGMNDFELARDEIYVSDKNLTKLYCSSVKANEFHPESGASDGVMLYIRGTNKNNVMTLLSKVYLCVKDTFNDYPGLIINHYVVHTLQYGSSLSKLEEVEALRNAGEDKIHVMIPSALNGVECDGDESSKPQEGGEVIINIDDLLPPLPHFQTIPPKLQTTP